MHTFYHPDLPAGGGPIDLEADEQRHLQVRRIREGESFRVVDGRGGIAEARLEGKRQVIVAPRDEQPQPSLRLILAQALLPADRLDWALQKAVELGADRILVYGAEHASLRGERANRKEDRWSRLIREAAKQCGRARFPTAGYVPDVTAAFEAEPEANWWVADQAGTDPGGEAGVTAAGLVVGPEGGFSEAERALFRSRNLPVLRLSPWTLRSETVAAAGLALLQYAYREPTAGEHGLHDR